MATSGTQRSSRDVDRCIACFELKCWAGGKQKGTEGYFVEPTVFGDVQDHFKIAKEVQPLFCLERLPALIISLPMPAESRKAFEFSGTW